MEAVEQVNSVNVLAMGVPNADVDTCAHWPAIPRNTPNGAAVLALAQPHRCLTDDLVKKG
jgi:hypothetical protein